MSQINLMSGSEEASRPKKNLFSSSLFLSVVVLVVAFGVYFGALYYRESLESRLASLKAEGDAKTKLVSGDKANRVADFADRLSVIDGNLKKTTMLPNDPLSRIERVMIPEVNLSAYSYDVESGMVTISLVSDSFRAVAQQIVALKGAGAFSAVSVDGDVQIGSNGKIDADLNLTL